MLARTLRWLWRANPAVRDALAEKMRQAADERIIASPHVAAKFYPYRSDRTSYVVARVPERRDGSVELPVPPRELWWGYAETAEGYLSMGKEFVEKMGAILEAAGKPLKSARTILDFGCGSGIMIRWLRDVAEHGEVWGVDISGDHVVWCQQHLTPPFRFVTTTSFPHLPFEDRYFDLIYAGSVFTHIADLGEAWLLELKRVVRPGGLLYVTVQDERAVEGCMRGNDNPSLAAQLRGFEREAGFKRTPYSFFAINRVPGQGAPGQAQVFYSAEYLRRHWGRYLDVVSVTPNAYGNQTAMLLAK